MQVGRSRTGRARPVSVRYMILNMAVSWLLVLTGCVARSARVPLVPGTQPLVKIGLAASFEGLDRPLAYEALAGVKLALAERNESGGVAGYKIELVALNDFGEPDEARLQATEFAADPAVLGVITGWTNETAQAALPIYQRVGLAVAVPWSVFPELADRESGVVLVAADAQRTAGVLIEAVAATDPDWPALVGNGPSTGIYVELMRDLGLEPLVLPSPSAVDGNHSQEWASALVQSREQPPDVLILTTDGAMDSEVFRLLSSPDWVGAVFGGVEAGSSHLVNVAGGLADGLVFVSPAPAGRDMPHTEADSTPDTRGLGPRGVLAYDATHVLLDAIELAIRADGYPGRPGVATSLPQVRRSGLTGDIGFDATGRRADAPVWLYRIQDQRYPGQMLLSTGAARQGD